MNRLLALVPFALLTAFACSSGSIRDGYADDDDDTPVGEGGITPTPDTGPGISNDGGGGSSSGGGGGIAEVFVHSGTALYRLDPNTKEVTEVGDFSGNGEELFDIALDADGNMYGTSSKALYRIDKTNARCELVRRGSDNEYPNSLSFVPAGTIEADREVLVGYRDSDYVRIDRDSGQVQVVRSNALGNELVSSGDIVSIREGDFLTYLTVKPTPGGNCNSSECRACETNDCVFEVDPSTGEKITNLGSSKRTQVFGLAFWAGTLYGINTEGKLFEITTNSPPQVSNIPLDGLSSNVIRFYGAGSSTSAPRGPN